MVRGRQSPAQSGRRQRTIFLDSERQARPKALAQQQQRLRAMIKLRTTEREGTLQLARTLASPAQQRDYCGLWPPLDPSHPWWQDSLSRWGRTGFDHVNTPEAA